MECDLAEDEETFKRWNSEQFETMGSLDSEHCTYVQGSERRGGFSEQQQFASNVLTEIYVDGSFIAGFVTEGNIDDVKTLCLLWRAQAEESSLVLESI